MFANASRGERHGTRHNLWGTYFLVMLIALASLGQCTPASGAQEASRLLTLEEAYKMALATHEQIAIAEKEIKKSKLMPYKAFALMLPHVTLTGQWQQVNKPITSSPGNLLILPHDQTLGDIKVTNAIFNPNYFPQRREGHETINKNINNYYQTIQDVLFQVARQYYQVLRSGEQVENAKQMIKLGHEQVRTTKVKFAAGAVTEEVVLRAELDLASAENKFIESTHQNKLAKDTLRHLIALKMPQYEVVKPSALAEVQESYETLLGKAYGHRYDHKMALGQIELAKTDVEKVKAKFLPSVDASWEYYGVKHPQFDQEANNWIAMISVKLPVLEGGLRVWEIKEKLGSLEQAKLALDDKRRNIKVEVEDTMLTMRNNKSLLFQLQKQVVLAQKNYDIIYSKFKFGAATILDLSQAFTTLFSFKTDLINRTYDYQVSLLSLNKAIGEFVILLIRDTRPLNDNSFRKWTTSDNQTQPVEYKSNHQVEPLK